MLVFLAIGLGLQAQQTPPPEFKSAPLRGSIDAGGYAAYATAKAKTEFFNQLVDLQLSVTHDQSCVTRKGLAYEAAGQLEAAAEQFRLAANETAYGIALLFQGEAGKAASVCHGTCLGAALFQEGQLQQALIVFFQAGAYGFIATALRSADPETRVEATGQLIALSNQYPANAGIQYALATALPDPAETEKHLRQAIQLDPHLADAHFRLGVLYETQGKVPQAMSELQTSLDQDARLIEAHYRLSQLYSRADDSVKGRSELTLYQQLKAKQQSEAESNRVPVPNSPCPAP